MTVSDNELIVHAEVARRNAYAPYSEYKVGAALLDGREYIHLGSNVEVSGRNTSIHAEAMAMFKAVTDGARSFKKLAVAHVGDSGPCGLCLHTLSEFTDELEIIVVMDGELTTFDLADEFNNAYRPMGAAHHDHHEETEA